MKNALNEGLKNDPTIPPFKYNQQTPTFQNYNYQNISLLDFDNY